MWLHVVVAASVVCSGCDVLFEVRALPPGDGGAGDAATGTVCIDDGFDGTTLRTSTWQEFLSATQISVADELIFTYATTKSGSEFSGIFTPTQYDFTNSSVEVELTMPPKNSAQAALVVGVMGMDNDQLTIRKAGNLLQCVSSNSPTQNVVASTPYSPSAHHYLRIEHRAATNTISYQASADHVAWTQLAAIPAPFDVHSSYFQMLAGTFQVEPDPGEARFDNFRLVTPSCVAH